MKITTVSLVEEAEILKDLLWYLRGKVGADDYSPIKNAHLDALRDAILYIQDKELQNKGSFDD